ncbi:hypothetical protein [Myxacorys almedinensis]|uniref:Uncharacterized protein n=1 Tax=Myxacorys almedinensis A TaxID=2690445 RepID=A0A8J7Z5S2_9CYAN|nr:hypothetical protein [Myxacorys almedinensis]NDJ16933.1 hypothetical protein [Myxacorys almedinensis A]
MPRVPLNRRGQDGCFLAETPIFNAKFITEARAAAVVCAEAFIMANKPL